VTQIKVQLYKWLLIKSDNNGLLAEQRMFELWDCSNHDKQIMKRAVNQSCYTYPEMKAYVKKLAKLKTQTRIDQCTKGTKGTIDQSH
jgi:hypothetical protein